MVVVVVVDANVVAVVVDGDAVAAYVHNWLWIDR